jgi:hypothetical protein
MVLEVADWGKNSQSPTEDNPGLSEWVTVLVLEIR